ncbi:BPSL0761 family protein [Pseudomonas sp. SED1]|nr:BPSL0761 family protein [Pseudomonas sp. SED1]MDY0835242.1 BPSL0761 family protein [Pseudomonas sp. SED1]
MPCERTRSIVQAGEFLRELSRDQTLPESVRQQAKGLLRHYTEP